MAIAALLLMTHFSLESTPTIRGQRHLADCWQWWGQCLVFHEVAAGESGTFEVWRSHHRWSCFRETDNRL